MVRTPHHPHLALVGVLIAGLSTAHPVFGQSPAYVDSIDLRQQLLDEQTKLFISKLPQDAAAAVQDMHSAWSAYRDAVCAMEGELGIRRRGGSDPLAAQETVRQCFARETQAQMNNMNRYTEQYLATLAQQEVKQKKAEKELGDPTICKLPLQEKDYEVLSVGTYRGFKELNVEIGKFAMRPRQADVVVNAPVKPVVLVLMAYDPTVWNVRYTPDAKIIGVVLAGYHQQAILGVPRSVPLATAIYDERGPCGYFYAYQADAKLKKANERVRYMTGRDISALVTEAQDETFVVGSAATFDVDKLVSSRDYSLADYAAPAGPRAGQKGLDQLVEQGKLRLATKNDVDAWTVIAAAQYKQFNSKLEVPHRMRVGSTYVILGDVELPDGLTGANARAFIIPVGVAAPHGPKGHNEFFFMDLAACKASEGFTCFE